MSSIFERFELASFKRLYNNAKSVAKRNNKPTLLVLIDMIRCILKDHVGYMEYNLFNFVNKSKEKRDTYVTFDYSQYLYKTMNDPEGIKLFNSKLAFNKIFKDYLGRDFLDISNSTFEDFIERTILSKSNF